MIRKLLKTVYGRWLASIIEGAYKDPRYNANIPFLCHIVRKRVTLSRWLVLAHIEDILGPSNFTLRSKLSDPVAWGQLPSEWEDRAVYHKRYWGLMCVALRKGDLNWGREINLEEMGMAHMERRHVGT